MLGLITAFIIKISNTAKHSGTLDLKASSLIIWTGISYIAYYICDKVHINLLNNYPVSTANLGFDLIITISLILLFWGLYRISAILISELNQNNI